MTKQFLNLGLQSRKLQSMKRINNTKEVIFVVRSQKGVIQRKTNQIGEILRKIGQREESLDLLS